MKKYEINQSNLNSAPFQFAYHLSAYQIYEMNTKETAKVIDIQFVVDKIYQKLRQYFKSMMLLIEKIKMILSIYLGDPNL